MSLSKNKNDSSNFIYVTPATTLTIKILMEVLFTFVTNVKCKLLWVRFYILILVFFGFVC